MTVIAFDGKIIAADKQATNNGLRHICNKLEKIKGGYIAIAGTDNKSLPMVEWYKKGCKIKDFPPQIKDEFGLIIVFKNGEVYQYENAPYPIKRTDKIMAWGCGRDYAIGAMAAGKNAIDAVKITSDHSVDCGLGVDWVKIEGKCKHNQH